MDAKGMTQPIDENKLADDWWDALNAALVDACHSCGGLGWYRLVNTTGQPLDEHKVCDCGLEADRARLFAATHALMAQMVGDYSNGEVSHKQAVEWAAKLLPDRED